MDDVHVVQKKKQSASNPLQWFLWHLPKRHLTFVRDGISGSLKQGCITLFVLKVLKVLWIGYPRPWLVGVQQKHIVFDENLNPRERLYSQIMPVS